jgi:hypothetical protein
VCHLATLGADRVSLGEVLGSVVGEEDGPVPEETTLGKLPVVVALGSVSGGMVEPINFGCEDPGGGNTALIDQPAMALPTKFGYNCR